MKKSHRWAILALLVSFGYLISLAVAQNTSAAPSGQSVAGGPRLALIDVTRIFKTHTRFKQMMEEMKRDVQAAENRVKAERDAINKLMQRWSAQPQQGHPAICRDGRADCQSAGEAGRSTSTGRRASSCNASR